MRGVVGSVLATSLLIASMARAQPTPSCPGDCDLDGIVKIDELLRGVNFLLDGQAPAGCDELDDDRDGQVAINELILAVLEALSGCRLSGDAAAEAAAQAAVGLLDSFNVIALGGAAAGGSGSGGSAAAGGAAGLPSGASCKDGGKMDQTCATREGASRQTFVFHDCRTRVGDVLALVLDGTVVRTVHDAAFCESGLIPDDTPVDEQFTGFRRAVTNRDVTEIEFSGTFAHSFRFAGDTCAGPKGTETFDGLLAFRCAAGLGSSLCPPQGRDQSVTARALTVVRDAAGVAGACIGTSTLVGRIEVRDRISGQAFDAVCRQLLVRDQTLGAPDQIVRLDGGIGLDCVGEINVSTEIAVSRPADARCPSSGLLFMQLPDGSTSAVRYGQGGVEIDFDGDGKADRKAESCEDAALAQCG